MTALAVISTIAPVEVTTLSENGVRGVEDRLARNLFDLCEKWV